MKKLIMSPPVVVPDKALITSVIFSVPPQGSASISQSDSLSLQQLQSEILNRLDNPMLQSVYPHRIGRRSCVAVQLIDARKKTLGILITVTGNTLWPGESEFMSAIRWNICVPDATDMLWILREIDRVTVGHAC